MPYFVTAQEWLTQSQLLLLARPTTTRITTKYSLPDHGKPPRRTRPRALPTGAAATPPTATLTIKTYDPISGVTLKYATQKAAEVGRLVQIMGRLGRGMAGLDMDEEVSAPAVDSVMKGLNEVESSTGKVEAYVGKTPGKTAGGGKKGKKGRKQ